MRYFYLIWLVFVLLGSEPLAAQYLFPDNPVRVTTFGFQRDSVGEVSGSEVRYTYNESGKVLSFQEYHGGVLRLDANWIYRDDTLTRLRVANHVYNLPSASIRETTYTYWGGCLVYEETFDDYYNLPRWEITQYDSTTCQLLSKELLYDYRRNGEYQPSEKTVWTYPLGTMVESSYYYTTNGYVLRDTRTTYYDAFQRRYALVYASDTGVSSDSIHFYYANDTDMYPLAQKAYTSFRGAPFVLDNSSEVTFEENASITTRIGYTSDGAQRFIEVIRWQSELNDSGLVEKLNITNALTVHLSNFMSNSAEVQTFRYDCQDRMTERVIETESGRVNVRRFFYDGPPCDTPTAPPTPSITAYPNPVSDYLYVESELLAADSPRIDMVDMVGRVIPLNNPYTELGVFRARLWVGHLPSGMYYIRVQAGKTAAVVSFLKI